MRISHLAAGAAAAAATAALVAVVPRAAGTTWTGVGHLLGGLDARWTAVLAVVWFAGLVAYGPVLTASLPGLSTRQALALNLGGSAVANAVPGGAPLSLGLTTSMARSWGFGSRQVGAFLAVSNVWTVLGRVAVGVVGLAGWVLAGPGTAAGSATTAHFGHGLLWGVLGPLGLVVAVGVVLAGSERRTAAAAAAGGRIAGRLLRRPGLDERVARSAVATRRLAVGTSRQGWPRILLGLVAYSVLLVALLDGCLRALGHPAPLVVVIAAVGVERVAAAVPVTPGGAGLADLGVAAVLAAAGLGPAAAAGALLYRLFTFAAEIPVGGLVALGWVAGRRRSESGRTAPNAPNAPVAPVAPAVVVPTIVDPTAATTVPAAAARDRAEAAA